MRFAATLLFLLCATAWAQWPQFRGNPQLTGVAQAKLAPKLRVLWTHEAGEAIESSAAIDGGTVYAGIGNGELHALDLATGKLKWKYKAADLMGESSPAVSGGIVYVGDLDGTLHAVNAADGKKLWTLPTKGEIKASPVVVDGKVLIGSYDGTLYAADAKTGAVAWRVRTAAQVHATPSVVNGHAHITGCDGVLRVIRVKDGAEVYTVKIGSYTGASPALEGTMAYFGTFDNEVMAVDMAKRTILWRYEHPQRKFPFYSTPAVLGGRIYLGGRDKMLHALDAKTGKAVWTFATKARIDSSPAIADGRVWFGSNDGNLYALDVNTGKEVWELHRRRTDLGLARDRVRSHYHRGTGRSPLLPRTVKLFALCALACVGLPGGVHRDRSRTVRQAGKVGNSEVAHCTRAGGVQCRSWRCRLRRDPA